MKYTGFLTAVSKMGKLQYNGLNTNDATAEVNDIVNAKTAYAQAEKITGTLAFDGDATVNDVVASKTFFRDNPQSKLTGAIASIGATTYTPTTANQTITNKYLTGLQTIKGDVNLIPENIKVGSSLFGINGTADVISTGIAYTSIDLDGEPLSAVLYSDDDVAYDYIANQLTKLTSLTIPDTFTELGRRSIAYCSALVNLTLPSSLTTIGRETFYEDRLLQLASLPNSVTTIGIGAFENCESITLSTWPTSLTSIDYNAFRGCKNITFSDNPTGLTYFDPDGAFSGCEKVTFSTVPSGITYIGASMYYNCKGITIEVIPNEITYISIGAFRGCTSLTKMWISSSCTSIQANTVLNAPFRDCTSTLHIYCEASSKPAGWGTYWNYYDDTNQLTVTWDTTLAEFEAL